LYSGKLCLITFAAMKTKLLTTYTYFTLLVLATSITSCKQQEIKEQSRVITVSILPQKFLVEYLCGNHFKVNVLLPPGANHETFEPTPGDMRSFENAELYISTGLLDFERNWLSRFTDSGTGLTVINTSEGIPLLGGHCHNHSNDHDHESAGSDPHIWLSPSALKLQASNIVKAITSIDSANKEDFSSNLVAFNHLMDSIDNRIRQILSGSEGKSVMIFHPALAYFARDYGLTQISIEEEGKEPSAIRIKELIELAREKNIRSILISKEFDVRHAEAIAKEINAKVLVFDPMAANWTENMIHLANLIAQN
jgi:zinc transport system substrate-binding protein